MTRGLRIARGAAAALTVVAALAGGPPRSVVAGRTNSSGKPEVAQAVIAPPGPVLTLAHTPSASTPAESGRPPWADPDALRLRVDEAGVVAVTGAMLRNAGWALDVVEAARVRLSRQGRPIPYAILRDGVATADGTLRDTDRLVFVAAAPDSTYAPFAIYWLQPAAEPQRFAALSIAPPPPGSPVPATGTRVRAEMHLEQDDYFVGAFRPPGGDRWLWGAPLWAGQQRSISLPSTPPVHPEGSATLALRLVGVTNDPQRSPDHHPRLALADVERDAPAFEGLSAITVTMTVDANRWREAASGEGLRLHGADRDTSPDRGTVLDGIQVDQLALAWDAEATARDANGQPGTQLSFLVLSRDPTIVTGLAAPRIHAAAFPTGDASPMLWTVEDAAGDLGDPRDPGDPGAGHWIHLPAALPGTRVVVWTAGAESAPAAITRNRASDLSGAGRDGPWPGDRRGGAEWIVVADARLHGALAPLVAHRRSAGLSTALVDVQDVWDEGSHGVPDPAALSALLLRARARWDPAPRYVLLVGESNLDHRGGDARRRGQPGPPDLLPAWTLERADGSAATSDLPYVDHNGDGAPEIAIGRLPGADEGEVAAVVARVLAHEGRAIAAAPAPRAVLLDDGSNPALAEATARLAAVLAPRLRVARHDGAAMRAAGDDLPGVVRAELAAGALVVAYVGHGNADTWAPWPGGGRLLHARDLADTPNGAEATDRGLLVAATCLNGFFDHPVTGGSLAERWLLDPGGGVAAWAPSGAARLPAQAALLEALGSELALAPGRPVGDVIARAQRRVIAGRPDRREAAQSMVLLADPAMPLWPGAARRPLHLPRLGRP